MKKIIAIIAIAGLALVVSGSAEAVELIQPTSVLPYPTGWISYEDLIGGATKYVPERTIDMSGMTAGPLTDASQVVTQPGNGDAWEGVWWGTGAYRPAPWPSYRDPSVEFLAYDLGAPKDLVSVYLWPTTHGDHSKQNTDSFSILASNSAGGPWTSVGGGNMAMPGTSLPFNAQGPYPLTGFTGYQYVMFDVHTSYDMGGYGSPGLGEIGFEEAAAEVVVPEPAGLGLVGLALLAMRRRRS